MLGVSKANRKQIQACSTHWVVSVQLWSIHQDSISTLVQVWNFLWKPGNIICIWRGKKWNKNTLFAVFWCMSLHQSNISSIIINHIPSSGRHELSGSSISTTFTCFRSSWMISFSCSLLLSQSTNISNSELRLLDFLDSMCTRLTWFSCKHWLK